jgi:hypothetical protein
MRHIVSLKFILRQLSPISAQVGAPAMGQIKSAKWIAGLDLQPTIPKFDRLLDTQLVVMMQKKTIIRLYQKPASSGRFLIKSINWQLPVMANFFM